MNSDVLKGMWLQLRGEAKEAWGKITDDEWMEVQGDFDKLTGKIQEKYGYSRDRAQMEVDRFRTDMDRKYADNKDNL